jgi:hypothetical protein
MVREDHVPLGGGVARRLDGSTARRLDGSTARPLDRASGALIGLGDVPISGFAPDVWRAAVDNNGARP